MSIFKDFFVKEKPIFTGITRGLGGFGFGAAAGASGTGASGATMTRYDVDNSLQETTFIPLSDFQSGKEFTDTGYYTLEFVDHPPSFLSATCWCWGGGGGNGNGPGPGQGGAGGGVRGTFNFSDGDTFTLMVAEGGKGPGADYPGNTPHNATTPKGPFTDNNEGFPDGGVVTYNGAGGGGSSRIANTLIPYPTRNDAPTTYMLIGAGGGGGIGYTSDGTRDGRGGYPSGQGGGGYYSSDGDVTGSGGTQSAGGSGGSAGRQPAGYNGAKYYGGNSGSTGGGAGGGGYYGGGGAGGYYGMGGGGSGYIHPSCTSTASFLGNTTSREVASDDPSNPGTLDTTAYARGDDKSEPSGAGTGNPIATSNKNGFIKITIS
jgi:hypothetical protein